MAQILTTMVWLKSTKSWRPDLKIETINTNYKLMQLASSVLMIKDQPTTKGNSYNRQPYATKSTIWTPQLVGSPFPVSSKLPVRVPQKLEVNFPAAPSSPCACRKSWTLISRQNCGFCLSELWFCNGGFYLNKKQQLWFFPSELWCFSLNNKAESL